MQSTWHKIQQLKSSQELERNKEEFNWYTVQAEVLHPVQSGSYWDMPSAFATCGSSATMVVCLIVWHSYLFMM